MFLKSPSFPEEISWLEQYRWNRNFSGKQQNSKISKDKI